MFTFTREFTILASHNGDKLIFAVFIRKTQGKPTRLYNPLFSPPELFVQHSRSQLKLLQLSNDFSLPSLPKLTLGTDWPFVFITNEPSTCSSEFFSYFFFFREYEFTSGESKYAEYENMKDDREWRERNVIKFSGLYHRPNTQTRQFAHQKTVSVCFKLSPRFLVFLVDMKTIFFKLWNCLSYEYESLSFSGTPPQNIHHFHSSRNPNNRRTRQHCFAEHHTTAADERREWDFSSEERWGEKKL